jgi:hypothetical protein
MATTVFRCPNMGVRVQGWFADNGIENGETYESVICVACRQAHFVNPATGKVLGADEGDQAASVGGLVSGPLLI